MCKQRLNMSKEHNKTFIENNIGQVLSAEKIKYSIVQDEGDIDLKRLNLGIITGLPIWSGHSIVYGKILIETISKFIEKEINWFEWIIIDSDALSDKRYQELFGVRKWGYFESIFVQNGNRQKDYNSSNNYHNFIEFVKKQMIIRNNLLDENSSKTYKLAHDKNNLGIKIEDFISESKAIVNSNSIYKQEYLFDKMKYESNGNNYLYEDDDVTIYEPTRPSPLSSCFVNIKDNKNKAST